MNGKESSFFFFWHFWQSVIDQKEAETKSRRFTLIWPFKVGTLWRWIIWSEGTNRSYLLMPNQWSSNPLILANSKWQNYLQLMSFLGEITEEHLGKQSQKTVESNRNDLWKCQRTGGCLWPQHKRMWFVWPLWCWSSLISFSLKISSHEKISHLVFFIKQK